MTRILLVDDEAPLARGLTYAFEREGYEVVVAEDGATGAETALAQSFDLIVLDVMLPRLSGVEACRAIRAKSNVPIIMLTAKDAVRDVVAGLESGADDYVTKPFSAAELLSRIRAMLRRRELDRTAEGDAAQVVGGLKIDLLRGEVEVDGHGVRLTPSEFRILSLLATSPGVVHSRREIMEHLWGSSFV